MSLKLKQKFKMKFFAAIIAIFGAIALLQGAIAAAAAAATPTQYPYIGGSADWILKP